MATLTARPVLSEVFWQAPGAQVWIKRAFLVVVGIALMTLAAQIKVAVPPSPVAVNLGTFAVLTIGAAYGPRLGLATIMGYMLIGALGFDVFQSSTAELNGIAYMTGSTGGYLAGYVLAIGAMGLLARRGWDRSVLLMALAMLIGNALLYVPGLAWLSIWIENTGKLDVATYGSLWEQTMTWGMTPFLIGDAMKLALAALLLPALWKLVGNARG
ncbi:MAG: biotin transporter BioY [Pseudomonadota bacterium]